jgi:hypothetical protein
MAQYRAERLEKVSSTALAVKDTLAADGAGEGAARAVHLEKACHLLHWQHVWAAFEGS